MFNKLLKRSVKLGSLLGLRGTTLVSKFIFTIFIARFLGLDTFAIYGLILGIVGTAPTLTRIGLFTHISRMATHYSLKELVVELRMYGLSVLTLYGLATLAIYLASHLGGYPLHTTLLIVFATLAEHVIMDIFVLTNNLRKQLLANFILFIYSVAWISVYMVASYLNPALRNIDHLLLFWITGGTTTIFVSIALTYRWPWLNASSFTFNWMWYLSNIRKSWRLWISELCGLTTMYADRYLIGVLIPLEALGVYLFFWQIISSINNLVGASVLYAYRPLLLLADKHKDKLTFEKLSNHCLRDGVTLFTLMAMIIAVAMPYLIEFTGKRELENQSAIMWIIFALNIARVSNDTLKLTFFARHKDTYLMKSNLLGVMALVGFSLVLIPLFHISGAVMAGCLTALFVTLYLFKVDDEKLSY